MKNKKNTVFRIMLFVLCCVVLLSACSDTTENKTESETQETGENTMIITSADIAEYQVTRSDRASEKETSAATSFCNALKEELGTRPLIKTDWDDGSGIPEKEILFGNTERPESKAFAEKASAAGAGCAYGMINGKIILYAEETEGLDLIAAKFISDLFGNGSCYSTEESVPTLTEGCFAGYNCEEKLILEDGSEAKSALRTDILWGVNGHNRLHFPYGEENTEADLRLAAEMGSTIYRINFNPDNEEKLAYINDIIDRCHAYGMKVMMCMDDHSGTVEQISKRMTYIAENLGDRVDYFQIFNETDIWCALKEDGSFYDASDWTGMTKKYYNPERVPVMIEKMRAAIDAFRSAAPDAKLEINVGARHFPMFDYYVEAGLSWDVIGFDFYDLNGWKPKDFLARMENRYPGYEIMVCEANIPANNGRYTEEEQSQWLESFFTLMNEYDSDKLIGVMVYELMDESKVQKDDKWAGEAHFGIVNTNEDGTPGAVKLGYTALQKMLCGGKAEYRIVYTPVTQN